MNKFIRQNFGRGVTFKSFISWAFKSENLTDKYWGIIGVHQYYFYLMNRALH